VAAVSDDPRRGLRTSPVLAAGKAGGYGARYFKGLITLLGRCLDERFSSGTCGCVVCPVCMVRDCLEPTRRELVAQFGAYAKRERRSIVLRLPDWVDFRRLKRAVGNVRCAVTTLTKKGTYWSRVIDRWAGMIHVDSSAAQEDGRSQVRFRISVRILGHVDGPLDRGTIAGAWAASLERAQLAVGDRTTPTVLFRRVPSLRRTAVRITRVNQPLPARLIAMEPREPMEPLELIEYLGQVQEMRSLLGRSTLNRAITEGLRGETGSGIDGTTEPAALRKTDGRRPDRKGRR
jgi:hypothetical protein